MATAFATEATHIQKIGHLVGGRHRPRHRRERDHRTRLAAGLPLAVGRARRAPRRAVGDRRAARARDAADVRPGWMRKPVPLLDDDKPLDVIAAGDYRRVSRVVAGLEAPGAI